MPEFNQVLLLVLDNSWLPNEGLFCRTGTESILFQNSAFKIAGLQVHATLDCAEG